MDNYVHVGNIIEAERLRRKEQIFKGLETELCDHIEKAHAEDISQAHQTIEKSENVQRFENDIRSLNKAETEFLLNKIQRQICVDSESVLLKAFRSAAIRHLDDIEKGVYTDNPHNRKLGRVGQSYGGKNPYDIVLKLAAGKKIEKLDNGYTIKYEHKVDKESKNEKGLNLKGYVYAELLKDGKRVGYTVSEKGSGKDFNNKIAEWKNLAQKQQKK